MGTQVQRSGVAAKGDAGRAGGLSGQIDLLHILHTLHRSVRTVAEAQVGVGRHLDRQYGGAVILIGQQAGLLIPVVQGMGQGGLGQNRVKVFVVHIGLLLCHHLMALSTMPRIKYFCRNRKTTTTGRMASRAAAAAALMLLVV